MSRPFSNFMDALAAGVEAAKQQERDAIALRKKQAAGELVPPTKSYDLTGPNALGNYHAMLADAQAAQAAEAKAAPIPEGREVHESWQAAMDAGALDMPDWQAPASGEVEIAERFAAFKENFAKEASHD